jgi:hypothetical protein
VAQHRDPDFLVDPLLHIKTQLRSHPGEALVAELVNPTFAQGD